MSRSILFLLLLGLSFSAQAQTSLFDALHATGDTLRLVFDIDLRDLRNRRDKKEFQPVHLQVDLPGRTIRLPGKVRARGNIRLKVCDNPSLKIKLNKDSLRNAGFTAMNDLKLVQQCSNSELGVSYLRRERLAYELHAVYSEHTHRTVPVVLHGKGKDPVYAFLVEEEESLRDRYGRVLTPLKASTGGMHRPTYVNLCLFNYLIMNSDWQVFNLHNVELVADTITKQLIPIPYDFDYSGFVGTSYSIGREDLDQSSVYDAVWQGRNVTPAEMKAGAEHFRSRYGAARSLIATYPALRPGQRKRLLRRLDDFQKLLDNEKRLLRLLK